MARQPIQIHVYLYRERNGKFEYAVFQRSDMTCCWQGVCGGLEDGETLEQGVRRELAEEAGIKGDFPLYRLESISYIPDKIYGKECQNVWGKPVVVVPMYYFAMPYDGKIICSYEHSDVKWLPYNRAFDLVYFDSQKTALYELNERLTRGIL